VAAPDLVPALSCPRCRQGTLIAGKRGWGCARWRDGCPFVIWFQVAGKRVTPVQLRDLVEKGKTRKGKVVAARRLAGGRTVGAGPGPPPERAALRASNPTDSLGVRRSRRSEAGIAVSPGAAGLRAARPRRMPAATSPATGAP